MEQDISYGKAKDVNYLAGPLRYYWISYAGAHRDFERCIDIHPFTHIQQLNNSPSIVIPYTLSAWKQIDCEEYNLWHSLNK